MQSDKNQGGVRKDRGDFLFYLMRRIIPFFILGIIYFVWLRMTEIYIPCLFRQITGCKCPGCGITTMCVDIGTFDFLGAFYANPFIFVTLPFIIFEILYCEFINFKKRKMPVWNNFLLAFYCAGLIIFGIVRNVI
ncbi:MAG: DUF2752 domain-containing protein [Hornefia sp.]|nr:DUF2752 domain-containing protein [Hornefia sp.]